MDDILICLVACAVVQAIYLLIDNWFGSSKEESDTWYESSYYLPQQEPFDVNWGDKVIINGRELLVDNEHKDDYSIKLFVSGEDKDYFQSIFEKDCVPSIMVTKRDYEIEFSGNKGVLLGSFISYRDNESVVITFDYYRLRQVDGQKV